jgi:serine/threonine protein kinase
MVRSIFHTFAKANVLVNNSGEGVLGDFGQSRVAEGVARPSGNTTISMGVTGTIRWMAPELLHDEPEGSRAVGPTLSSDVWAFGCTFYEASHILSYLYAVDSENQPCCSCCSGKCHTHLGNTFGRSLMISCVVCIHSPKKMQHKWDQKRCGWL